MHRWGDYKEKNRNSHNMNDVFTCNGEQVAGFKDIHTDKIEEVMLIKNQADLDAFKKMYGIDDEIEKEY